MKNQINARSAQNAAASAAHRSAAPRLQPPKSIVHRHERRKIREQLRRLDSAAGWEDAAFA